MAEDSGSSAYTVNQDNYNQSYGSQLPSSRGSQDVTRYDDSKKPDESPSECAEVKRLCEQVRAAKKKFEPDFKRMRQNIEFMAGKQWDEQVELDFHKYICNITMQMVNQKVATLYAKEPKVVARRRQRMEFQVWDEKQESIVQAIQSAMVHVQKGLFDMQSEAIIMDYQRGIKWREMVEKVGRTLEYLYKYETDSQELDFKESMKQLVTDAVTCGVGYVRLNFVRDVMSNPSFQLAPGKLVDRVKQAKMLLDKLKDNELQEDDPRLETLKQLFNSIGSQSSEQVEVKERLVFDFIEPTAVILDTKCKSLKTFAGARWLAVEYLLALDEVNSFFGTKIDPGGELVSYKETGVEATTTDIALANLRGETTKPLVCLWEVFNYTTKSRCFVVDGHKYYVMKPEPQNNTKRFWPIVALVFNPVVKTSGIKSSIYPSSDVQLMKHPQKEWNRSRFALRAQRRANAPKYIARHGLLTEQDKDALDSADENEVIELQGIPSDMEPSKFILPMVHPPIDPMAYDTKPLEEDIMLATRAQEANMGPAKPNVTATVGTIAEQSRVTVAASNVDDLDSVLSALAHMGGELLLREMSIETVQRVVGQGAVWPMMNKEDFLNEIYLEIEAASSGRPNKALEVANFERLVPFLIQMGANPMFLIKEAVKRLDDRLDVNEAFPIPLPMAPMQPTGPGAQSQGAPQQGPGPPAVPQQPLQQLPSESPVPLAAG